MSPEKHHKLSMRKCPIVYVHLHFYSYTKNLPSFYKIHRWVSENTHGKISEIVPKVMNPNTKIVLANALYFKAEWQQTFFEGATGPKPFYPHGRGGKSIMVDLMAQGGHFPHYRDTELNVDILGFPYKQNCTTMYVILPSDSSTERLKEVQKELTADKIESMIDQMTIKTAVILFPKMHLKSGYHFKTDLQELGVKSLFEESESDLSLMSSENCAKMREGCGHKITFSDPFSTFRRNKRDVTYKVGSENKDSPYPLSMKDFFNRKRIVKKNHGKKSKKTKREVKRMSSLDRLEFLRNKQLTNPQVFADDVIHKVDLNINEKGTEGKRLINSEVFRQFVIGNFANGNRFVVQYKYLNVSLSFLRK